LAKPSTTISASGEYIRVETIGRKSGKPHQVLLRYVRTGEKILVLPQSTSVQDWVFNLKGNPRVRVFTERGIFSGNATFRKIVENNDPLLVAFTRKYGIQTMVQRYGGQHSYIELRLDKDESCNMDEIVYGDIEAAFDGVAENYDQHILGNPINTWLRNVSVQILRQHFHPGSVVVELGCGTGTETLDLARHGVTVLACDISGKMLEVLERKSKHENLQHRVIPVHCKAGEFTESIRALGFTKIDGAYSTYGTINTEPRLNDLFRGLYDLLKPDGTLILGVWNKYCVYEILGYILRAKPSLAVGRFRNPVGIGSSRFCIKSNAYSPISLGKYLNPLFKRTSVFGVVILLPPSNLTRYLPRGRLFTTFKRLDLCIGRLFPFNRLGDHFLAIYSPRGRSAK
jgi:deazaflavin-dependent oxidoreductase (nitroreductase family)